MRVCIFYCMFGKNADWPKHTYSLQSKGALAGSAFYVCYSEPPQPRAIYFVFSYEALGGRGYSKKGYGSRDRYLTRQEFRLSTKCR